MANSSQVNNVFAFEDFRLEAAERRLCRGNALIALTPKTFDLLLFLVENEGRLLRKEDLLASVWPDAAVEENNLTVAVSALRKALGESGGCRFVETVPKTGYRFVASVTKLSAESIAAEDGRIGVPESQGPPRPGPQKGFAARNRWSFVLLLMAALTLVGVIVFQKRALPKRPAAAPRRLAILPFRNLRGNADDQFLALSLADAVIHRLGSIHTLTVRPSYDIQKYASQAIDLHKVANDLGVDAILTGTFIHEGDDLRIAGQLIDITTHDILWNGGFDVKYKNLLTVQEKVARQIVEGLALTLTPSEAEKLKTAETIGSMAYEYYLRGVDLYAKNDYQLASKVLERSIELAPNYSPSWANLGRAYTASASFQFGGDDVYHKAEEAFARAAALQPDAIDARVYLANMFTDTGRVEKAVPLLREAARTNPMHAESHWELGYAYRFAGMLEQSASECERARQLDPAVKLTSSTLNSYLYLGRYDRFLESLPKAEDAALIVFYRGFGEYYRKNHQRAIANFDQAFELDHFMLQARVGKSMSLALQHRHTEAKTILKALESKTHSRGAYDPEAMYKIAQAYAVAGDRTSALRVLRRSIENGFFPYPYLRSDPVLNSLRGETEFSDLMESAHRRHDAFRRTFF